MLDVRALLLSGSCQRRSERNDARHGSKAANTRQEKMATCDCGNESGEREKEQKSGNGHPDKVLPSWSFDFVEDTAVGGHKQLHHVVKGNQHPKK